MKRVLWILIIGVLALWSGTFVSAQGMPDYWPTDGWQISTPEAQGLSSEELARYFSTWSQEQFQLDSLLVVRNGYLVAEGYAPLNAADESHNVYSVTKSITSTLIGMLIQDGLLQSVDTPVLSLFPDWRIDNVDARKEALTVRDLLTMSGGLESNEMEAAQLGVTDTAEIMESTLDWTQFALDQPMARDPGAQWYYSNVSAQLLSGIISELSGKSALDYATEKLFGPLGIRDVRWNSSPTGVTFGASDLYLTPRDMAKIGYLYLNRGVWDGQQIIPADYAAQAIAKQINTPWDGTTYGYLWWRIEPINMSFALGHGGQYILLLPDRNMVVVATGGMTEDLRVPLNGYPMFFSIAALSVAEGALPENRAGTEQLAQVLDTMQNPAPTALQPLPDMAAQVSGRTYVLFKPDLFFSSNFVKRFMRYNELTDAMQVQNLSLTFDQNDEALMTLGFTDGGSWALPVGLDGLYRVSEGRLGTVGVKGAWLTDDLFRVYLKQAGTAVQYRFDVNYIPGALNITSFEYTSGGATAILGFAPQ